ncbi:MULTISPECIES: carbonic anhydrase [unclassified Cyanobium]|uniref:carbonic anhydrase n=1 Tax=unclassified Cyanobium TaxID=2627006 RepID=UPI0020CBA6F2|nr:MULTISPECIES: carbonic anhydrase [unclassified Cyanobium]MCP9834245.1 carbonic anhydrase [Cyanobium sp. La Preciosa 7G6]MCP9937119.1 carbonic anhydrase [Cyanobium sp. Aljojuca 7A6]
MAHSRRHLLQYLGLAGAGLALNTLRPAEAAAAAAAAGGSLAERLSVCRPSGDPLQELLRRNRDFCKAWQAAERSEDPQGRATLLHETWPLHCQVRPDALAAGQRPWAAVLCCADSRVAPEWIFACGAGELFEVRSAGNTAFDEGIASLEYAVAELAMPLILVMGHSGCGAVTAAMASAPLTPLLEELVAPIRASLKPGADLAQAVRTNAAAAAADLPQRSALLREALADGRLRIQAAYFDIGSGEVSLV